MSRQRSGGPGPCCGHAWTGPERRSHLGGQLGAALCDRFFELTWITRAPHHPRAVAVTAEGARGLADHLGIEIGAADA